MTAPGGADAPARPEGRRPVDVLYVSLGTTLGLRLADDQLVATLRRAGLVVELVRAEPRGAVRTLVLTDLVQARAAAAAARAGLRQVEPRQIIYSTTTAAMFWPRPGAIRFDALAQVTRPGRHGLWQRTLERRRLRQAPLLIPCDAASLDGASAAVRARPTVVVPIPLGAGEHDVRAVDRQKTTPNGLDDAPQQPGHAAAASAKAPSVDVVLAAAGVTADERPVAVTYAADAHKKGLDRVLDAWAKVRRPGEVLIVAGRDALPAGLGPVAGVRLAGILPPATFRAVVRAVGVMVLAPRREDYGLVQLEALAEGARVVTTAAPGPYAALPLLRVLWPEQVVEDADADDPLRLGAALRHAVDARPDAEDLMRATAAVGPWRAEAVQALVERTLAPALLPPS